MHSFWALIIGILFGCGTFLILRRSIVKIILGVIILSQAANLAIFIAGGINRDQPAIIDVGETVYQHDVDPLTQALILTAIVIGFAVQAFLIILIKRHYEKNRIADSDQMQERDQ